MKSRKTIMKKIKFLALAFAAMFMVSLVSCSSPDSDAKKLVELQYEYREFAKECQDKYEDDKEAKKEFKEAYEKYRDELRDDYNLE